ncbi:MAG: protein kinase [Chloroflexota bacterium]
MPLDTGKILKDRYRIVKLLGQGGFGAVYRAWDMNLDRPCALKENLETSEVAQRQFEREAKILANLSHPGLPHVSDHFFIPGQGQYLVMDYIEGEDLQQLLDRAGPPPVERALEWIYQVCDALTHMHAQAPAVIHRDIKPANIRVMRTTGSPHGRAMLVDFGIAKMYTPGARTTVGARAVTPGYSPPEQYGQGFTDAQSDVYALGATLYTLLTNLAPPDSVDIMSGATQPPRQAHLLNPQVPPAVGAVIAQAMQVNRAQRLGSVSAFKLALERAMQMGNRPVQPVSSTERMAPVYAPPAAPPAAQPRPTSRPAPAPRARRPAWPMLAAGLLGVFILAIGGALGGLWFWDQLNGNGEPTPVGQVSATTGKASPTSETGSGGLPETPQTSQTPQTLPTFTPAPNYTPTPIPSPTTVPPPEPGAVLVTLPESWIAFASDRPSDSKERLYVVQVHGGDYWFVGQPGGVASLSVISASPFSEPVQLPTDENYNRAWWPDFCLGNQVILYEIQDSKNTQFQGIYKVPLDGSSGPAAAVSMPGFAKLGVPRCSNDGQRVIFSALSSAQGSDWSLYEYNLGTQAAPGLVGDGYAFAGNVGWSRADDWIVFMRRVGTQNFHLVKLFLGNPFSPVDLDKAETTTEKYPAVSPTTSDIAFACFKDQWNLCLMDSSGGGLRALVENLGKSESSISIVTPSFSPDGNWIVFSTIGADGSRDLFIYSIAHNLRFPLAASIPGDQFHPSWSKP